MVKARSSGHNGECHGVAAWSLKHYPCELPRAVAHGWVAPLGHTMYRKAWRALKRKGRKKKRAAQGLAGPQAIHTPDAPLGRSSGHVQDDHVQERLTASRGAGWQVEPPPHARTHARTHRRTHTHTPRTHTWYINGLCAHPVRPLTHPPR